MKKYAFFLLVGILMILTLASCGRDPWETDWYKDWNTTASEETTTVPEETTTVPEETTTVPEETTTVPEETTTVPEETTTVPEETTTVPEETTTIPEETTTAPEETTTEFEWEYEDIPSPGGSDDPEVSQYSITYVLNGGSLSGSVVRNYTSSEAVTLPIPTRTDYSFEGWYEAGDFSGTAVVEIAIGSTGNKTFYAKWVSNKVEDTEPEAPTTPPETTEDEYLFPIIPLPSEDANE